MSEVNTDPKFCPPAAALKTVGLTVADVKSTDSLFALITDRLAIAERSENQASVAIFIAFQRGFDHEAIAKRINISVSSVKRRVIEGMGIMRTGEVARTTSAIRTGTLSKSKVDDLTRGINDSEVKITALEKAVVSDALTNAYVNSTGAPIAVTDQFTTEVYEAAVSAAIADSVPATSANIMQYVPVVGESFSIKRKPSTPATPNPQGGSSTTMHLEFNLRKAVADMQQIALDSDAPYVPTPQDWAAFVALTQYLDIFVPLSDEITASVEALLPY
jgi:hypothetical protein